MTSAGGLRAAQLAGVVSTLADKPGVTAYVLGMHVPVPQPRPGPAQAGLLAASAPLPLVLGRLRELHNAGRAGKIPGPGSDRWYLIVTAGCSDCGDTLTVASGGAKRYCRPTRVLTSPPVTRSSSTRTPRTASRHAPKLTAAPPVPAIARARRTAPTAFEPAAAAATRTGAAGMADRLPWGALNTILCERRERERRSLPRLKARVSTPRL